MAISKEERARINKQNARNAGRKPGTKNKATLEREKVLAAIREKIMGVAEPLVLSQLHLAMGMSYLMKIEKKMKVGPKGGISWEPQRPVRVESLSEIESYLCGLTGHEDLDTGPGATYYYITAVPPNNSAIDSLMDRTFDKPKQRTELTGANGEALFPDPDAKAKSDDALRQYMTVKNLLGAPPAKGRKKKTEAVV